MKTKITYVMPHAANDCILRVRVGQRQADFRGFPDGSWCELAAHGRDYNYLAAVLDAHAAAIRHACR